MTYRPLVVGIADLRRHPGTRRQFAESIVLPDLGITSAAVPEGAAIDLDLELETLSNGLVATGTITTPWVGECRRCLQMVEGRSVAPIREIFEPRPVEGETYPMAEDMVNLEPMVRDAVLLALPLAPLCGQECRGPAPELFPTGPESQLEESESSQDLGVRADPRWAALAELDFEPDDPGE
ncbi:MAG: YceD family protein [Acidimicrobiales bacterium]